MHVPVYVHAHTHSSPEHAVHLICTQKHVLDGWLVTLEVSYGRSLWLKGKVRIEWGPRNARCCIFITDCGTGTPGTCVSQVHLGIQCALGVGNDANSESTFSSQKPLVFNSG